MIASNRFMPNKLIKHLFVTAALVNCSSLVVASNSELLQSDDSESFDIKLSSIAGYDRYGSFYDKKGKDLSEEVYLRRVKLGLDYRPLTNWAIELSVSFSRDEQNKWDLGDANISYLGFKTVEIKVGHMHEPFGFERLTGLTKIATIERSVATSAFAPGRSYGLQVGNNKRRYTWALGIFQDDDNSASPHAITGRLTYAPYNKKDVVIHLGFSGSYRDHKNNEFQIKENGEVFTASNVIRSAKFDADERYLLGLEFAGTYNNWTFSSEAMAQKVSQQNGEDWLYSGYYAQLSYFITGESRLYKHGGFKAIKANSKSGAFELVVRHGGVYLRDHGIGSDSQISLLGIHYYYDKALQLKLNVLFPQISGNSLQEDPSGIASIFRLQYTF